MIDREVIQYILVKDYLTIVRSYEEDAASCAMLQTKLKTFTDHQIHPAVLIPGPSCRPKYIEVNFKKFNDGVQISRELVRMLAGGGYAIYNDKAMFFEVTINMFPTFLFTTKLSSGMPIDTPLICAIDKRSLSLVNTVLNNFHFVEHEFNEPKSHRQYMLNCISYAKRYYSGQTAILKMLSGILDIRIHLLAAMKQDLTSEHSLNSTNRLCSSDSFSSYKSTNPDEYNMIVKVCMQYAKTMPGSYTISAK